MARYQAGMLVRAQMSGEWQVAYIYDVITLSDGSLQYKVKRRDWNEYADVEESQIEPLKRGLVLASNLKYSVGQQVESLQGSTWYEATILEKKNHLYYIKYNQYNEWDWVSDEDLRGEVQVQNPQVPINNNTPKSNAEGGGGDVGGAPKYVVILKKDSLYRVNVTDGSFSLLSPAWLDVKGMTAAGEWVFFVAGEKLYKVHVESGKQVLLGDGWSDVKGIAVL